LGVLGTQETFCIVIAGLLERDSFDLLLPEFDKPWVIHLREIAAVLRTSALGGPTLSIGIEACLEITREDNGVAVAGVGLVLVSLGRLQDLLDEGLLIVATGHECLVHRG
jgi:hypothetical protein